MSWNSAVQRAEDFLAQYPVNANVPFTRLNSVEVDQHAIDNGHYVNVDLGNAADVNQARNKFIKQLNATGCAPRWWKIMKSPPFHIKVVERFKGTPTVWEVQPTDVSVSHLTLQFPDRSHKTFINRIVDIEKQADSVDQKKLSDPEKQLHKHQLNLLSKGAQAELDVARLSNESLRKAAERLAKIDPDNRLLLK